MFIIDYNYVKAGKKNVVGRIGQLYTLSCIMRDLPETGHWTWRYEQKPLSGPNKMVSSEKHLSSLTILKLDKSHFGEYTCEYEDRIHRYSFYDTTYLTKNPRPEKVPQSDLKGLFNISKYCHHCCF